MKGEERTRGERRGKDGEKVRVRGEGKERVQGAKNRQPNARACRGGT